MSRGLRVQQGKFCKKKGKVQQHLQESNMTSTEIPPESTIVGFKLVTVSNTRSLTKKSVKLPKNKKEALNKNLKNLLNDKQ